jgi:hypothetical protein
MVQENLGAYMLEQEGIMKTFLRLKVEALARVRDDALDELVTHAEAKVLEQGTELDVRHTEPEQLSPPCAVKDPNSHQQAILPHWICMLQPFFVPSHL